MLSRESMRSTEYMYVDFNQLRQSNNEKIQEVDTSLIFKAFNISV